MKTKRYFLPSRFRAFALSCDFIVSATIAAMLCMVTACTSKADYPFQPQDIRFSVPYAAAPFKGDLYANSSAEECKIELQVNMGYGRLVTVSADPVQGIFISPQPYQLENTGASQTISLNVEGLSSASPGKYFLIVDLVYDGKKISWSVPFEILKKPDFDGAMDPEFGGCILLKSNYAFFKAYRYNVLGTAFPSSNPILLKIPYKNGGGRNVALDPYRIVDEKNNDITSQFTLELLTPKLEMTAQDTIFLRFKPNNTILGHKTMIIKDFSLTLTDPADPTYIYKMDASNGVFFGPGRLHFRTFDILWTHNLSFDGKEKILIGYDTVHVQSKLTAGRYRALFVQALGQIDEPYTTPKLYVNPFLYQWGRKEDGHQKAWSSAAGFISGARSAKEDNPTSGDFLYSSPTPSAWQSSPALSDVLWNDDATGGINNPCPTGYRVPSVAEGCESYQSPGGTANDTPGDGYMTGWNCGYMGLRNQSTGALTVNTNWNVWASRPSIDGKISQVNQAMNFQVQGGTPGAYNDQTQGRANGMPVRCISIANLN